MKKALIIGGIVFFGMIIASMIINPIINCYYEKTHKAEITISIVETAEVGTSVKLEKKASFSPFLQEKIKYEFVGENSCNARFEHVLDKNQNFYNTFVIAELPGTVSIKLSYIDNNETIAESNTITIKFFANAVNTIEDLKAIANSDKSYVLGADIDLSSEPNWTPIEGFKGSLNGNGYSIKNLSLKVKSNDNIGLFSELLGTVNNLKIENVKITGSGSGNNIGAIAGKNTGTIQNCVVDGTINCEYASCVGGIAGYSNTNLINNINNVAVKSNEKVGGIAGCIVVSGALEIKSNTNNNEVSGTTYVGGIAGSIESIKPANGTFTTMVSDCENNGIVTATGDFSGGIAGQATGYYLSDRWGTLYSIYLEISDCENNGKVYGKDYVAGIYGYGGEYVRSVTACVNTVDITGNNYVGGYIGYSENTSISNMNNNNIIIGKGYLGGIAGYVGDIQNCKNNGTITSLGTILEDGINKYCVGGIAGYATGVKNCVNNVDISVESSGINVGGIAGYIYCNGVIEDNTNNGRIAALQANNVGGIVGKVTLTGGRTINNNINESEVTATSYVGGIVGLIESIKPANGTFTTMVSDCENNGIVTATGDFSGGIAGQATGYYLSDRWGTLYSIYLEFSNNINNEKVISGSDQTYAAIVGKAFDYVNSQNPALWSSNKDYGNVGKIYN